MLVGNSFGKFLQQREVWNIRDILSASMYTVSVSCWRQLSSDEQNLIFMTLQLSDSMPGWESGYIGCRGVDKDGRAASAEIPRISDERKGFASHTERA